MAVNFIFIRLFNTNRFMAAISVLISRPIASSLDVFKDEP